LNAPQHAGGKFGAVTTFRRVCVVCPAHFSEQFNSARLKRILRFGSSSREKLLVELVNDMPSLAPTLDNGLFDVRWLVGNGIRAGEYGMERRKSCSEALSSVVTPCEASHVGRHRASATQVTSVSVARAARRGRQTGDISVRP